jgi:hypothetical protein
VILLVGLVCGAIGVLLATWCTRDIVLALLLSVLYAFAVFAIVLLILGGVIFGV